MEPNQLKNAENHFAFGKNWASFSMLIDEARITSATGDLVRFFGAHGLSGLRFLDIGSGSGLHSAAAGRLGARELVCVDVDSDSVETSRKVVTEYAPGVEAHFLARSVFDLDPKQLGLFDVVYSWGVLHHTGDLAAAIEKACDMVRPGGKLMLALYRKTWLCPVWRLEKKWYANTSAENQRKAFDFYVAMMRFRFLIKGRSFDEFVREFQNKRGMSFEHDVHDWLGGYPYESVSPRELDRLLMARGFSLQKSTFKRRRQVGLMGSGNDKYLYQKSTSTESP